MKKILVTLVVAVMLFSLAGCAAEPVTETPSETMEETTLKIGVSLMNQQQGFHISLKEGAESMAAELGVEVVFLDADLDAAKQISDVEDLIIQEVDAIIMSPVDSEGIVGAVQKAIDAGIPVVTADTMATGIEVTSHVGSDNYYGGQIGAEELLKYVGETGGKVAFIGNPINSTSIDRQKGFEDTMAEVDNIEVLQYIAGESVRDKSMSAVEDVLNTHPDIVGLMGVNDDSALGALAAVEAAGLSDQVTIIGYDATEEAAAIIDAGNSALKADVIQYPEKIGSSAMETAVSAAMGESVESIVPVEVGIYSK